MAAFKLLSSRNAAVFTLVLAVLFNSLSKWAQAPLPVNKVDLTGKVAIVTGASAGIGKETARILADWGAEVIMACRDEAKAGRVLEDIKQSTGSKKVEVWKMDLASLASVRSFAEKFAQSGKQLHLLINNAGVVMDDRHVTEDGHEVTYQTNHLGHFLLTKLLMPRLLSSAPSRAIQVSSDAHYVGKVPFDNLDREKGYGWSLFVYADSKLMNVLFANELHKRYGSSGVISTSLHPGFVRTEFNRNTHAAMKLVLGGIAKWLARDEYQGALTTIHAATDPEVQGGTYFASCKKAKQNPLALNETLAQQLWELSDASVAKWAHPTLRFRR